jgi:phosphoribosylformimino-5-aminoimidazole carboxamide ribotide isomerase
MIVFPAIDLRHGRCVRLRQGRAEDETVYGDDPAAVARRWVTRGAQWLHVVNLDGAFGESHTPAQRPVNLRRLQEICAAVPDTPVQFGGGVRSLDDVQAALDLGATRVILGTVAVREPDLVTQGMRRFGAERIVIGIDARDGLVATHGWREVSNTTAIALAQAMRKRGVRRVVYTDIARDGMLTGVNVEATTALAQAAGLQVIASGGVASLVDIRRLKAQSLAPTSGERADAPGGSIEGVIIGQALYTGAVALPEALEAAAG